MKNLDNKMKEHVNQQPDVCSYVIKSNDPKTWNRDV